MPPHAVKRKQPDSSLWQFTSPPPVDRFNAATQNSRRCVPSTSTSQPQHSHSNQSLPSTFDYNLQSQSNSPELLPKNTPILRRIYTTSIPRVIDVAINHSNVKIFNKPLLGSMTSLIQIPITPNPLLIMNLTLIHFPILIWAFQNGIKPIRALPPHVRPFSTNPGHKTQLFYLIQHQILFKMFQPEQLLSLLLITLFYVNQLLLHSLPHGHHQLILSDLFIPSTVLIVHLLTTLQDMSHLCIVTF